MIYFILIIIIVFCGAVIIYLVSKKAAKLKLIAVEEIPKEKQSEVKKQLLESQLRKRLSGLFGGMIGLVMTTIKKVSVTASKAIKVVRGRKIERSSRRMIIEKTIIKEEKKLDNEWQEKFQLAQDLFKKKRLEEAEEKYIDILKDNPKNKEVYMALGEIYMNRKEWQLAEETYRHVMRIDPNFLPAQKILAELLVANKKWDELKQLSQYIIKNGCEEAWVYIKLGFSYRKTGYADVAEEYFVKAVELEPKNVLALDYLIEAAIINKNKPLALKAFNTLTGIEKNPIKFQGYKDKIDIL
ncbi:tetratricopeptide repeat protein [Candidatus Kuenenbacteria bacterium]|nr:tetratricopeptide repeat protein [Candidatus Kuenenbacteria bacterium]